MIETKDSGINRIGDIPKHWKISKIKYMAILKGRIGWQGLTSDEYTDEGAYLITGTDFENGTINWDSGVHVPIERWQEARDIQIENGDLLITKDGTIGKVAVVSNCHEPTSLNSGVLRIITTEEYSKKFLYWILCSEVFWTWFKDKNIGNSTIQHLYQSDFAEFKFVSPPIDEQKAISDFLDEECGKIDEIISGVKNQIEILKEYKKSLITETVTKGLNPTAEMKDSGINRIGEIPKHWKISKLKYVSKINEKILSESTPPDYKFRYVDISSIKSMVGIESYKEMTFDVAPSRARRLVSVGDTIISTVRTYLRAIAFIDESANIVVSTGFSVHTPLEVIYPKYLYYVCISDFFIAIVNEYSTGVSYPAISDNLLGRISVPVPPLDEQKAISDFLDEECGKIDELIEQKQKQLETLAEYKKSVIYEYVTGKKRVEEC